MTSFIAELHDEGEDIEYIDDDELEDIDDLEYEDQELDS